MNTDFYTTIGLRLREIRKQYGLSQLMLEIEAGLQIGTISRIEKGKINPLKETLYKIAYALHLKQSELLFLLAFDVFEETVRR